MVEDLVVLPRAVDGDRQVVFLDPVNIELLRNRQRASYGNGGFVLEHVAQVGRFDDLKIFAVHVDLVQVTGAGVIDHDLAEVKWVGVLRHGGAGTGQGENRGTVEQGAQDHPPAPRGRLWPNVGLMAGGMLAGLR